MFNEKSTAQKGRRIAAVSPDIFVRILRGPVSCDLRLRRRLGTTLCSNNTAELIGLPKATDGLISSFLAVNVCAAFVIPYTRPVSRVVLPTQNKIALATRCNELLLRLKCKFHVSVRYVFSLAGNECADFVASLDIRSFL